MICGGLWPIWYEMICGMDDDNDDEYRQCTVVPIILALKMRNVNCRSSAEATLQNSTKVCTHLLNFKFI